MQRINFDSFWSRYRALPFKDDALSKALARLPNVGEHGPWIGGGAIRRTIQREALESDFDFFFASEGQFKTFVENIKLRGGEQLFETPTNITFLVPSEGDEPTLKVQAIRAGYHPTLEAMLATFDFSLCQCGYDGTDLVLGDWTLYDLARKRLIPGRISFGVSSLRRMLKYTRQGYTVCSGGLSDFLQQIADDPKIINQNVVSLD